MRIYAFSSANLTNIWAGVGAQMWAVPLSKDNNSNKGRTTKAARMTAGSLGVLYSSKDRAFTCPFIVLRAPEPTSVVTHVWEGEWILPFAIRTLGNPHSRLEWEEAKNLLPSCVAGTALNKLIHIEPLTVFAANEIADADWALIIEKLAS